MEFMRSMILVVLVAPLATAATAPLLAAMLGADWKPKVCERVWISSIGCAEGQQTGKLTAGFGATCEKIGPEFTFGLYQQKFTDAPGANQQGGGGEMAAGASNPGYPTSRRRK